jgi:DNA-binding response OmpR family regulator
LKEAGAHEGTPDIARAPLAAAASDTTRRVLIVDDNRDAAESLAMLVEVLGYEAHVCFDGSTALIAVDDCHPDLILLDLTMPGMSGFDVVRQLRSRANPVRARIVALSGRADDEDRRLTEDAGFDAHLVKPVDVATLQATLRAAPPS